MIRAIALFTLLVAAGAAFGEDIPLWPDGAPGGKGTAAEMPFLAMDTGTRDAAHRTADAQVAMVKEFGFDGIGPTYTNPEALRYLFVVTINGADTGATDWGKLIQPLDSGSFDVKHLLAVLERAGYDGPVGLQHYGIKGDARANLQRSLDAWRKMRQPPR